jgi:3-methyladenine DNA glycosylase Tag
MSAATARLRINEAMQFWSSERRGAAKHLKSQGYRFVGPTSVYAFMQNVGVVTDHIRGCLRAADYAQSPTKARRR